MKAHTIDFKNQLTELGRELRGVITYNNTELEEEIYSITPHYNADLLKSVMKQLDIELSVDIPLNTIINCQIGIKVNEQYEMLNYGNYVVYKSEKQEDTGTYKLTCYDKMLYSMKEYEPMNITYPIKIRDYINAICNKLGLVFSNINDEFANYKKEIQNELYLDTDGNSLGYTFRDVLDELAEVTASIICINEDTDELEIRYPNETNDTIDEEFLKDINVKFGEKFGTVNIIVLSRSAGADNIYYPSELPENPCEIKIADNQIMNWNDRADYLPDIYNKLNGMNYYINDFSSIGILYYEVGDLYNVKVGENTYQCLMLNDEINVTTGIEEIIHTDMPEKSETDYSKADKTDRKINQTYLIVDKQNQQIQSVVNQIGDRSKKQTTITQDIDGINSKVENLEDVTENAEGLKEIELQNCVAGSLLELHIYGNNSVFDYLFPRNDLYPSDTLYPQGDSRIVVTDKDGNFKIYELGVLDVLRQNGNVRDEYVLEKEKAKVIRRINKNGTIKIQEEIEDLGEFSIPLNEGTNTIRIQNYNANIKAKFAIQNDYTDVFATKAEMNSSITQTAKEINLEVRKKVDEDEIISKINQSAEKISIEANKININGVVSANGNFEIDKEGNVSLAGNIYMTGTNTKIVGGDGLITNLQFKEDGYVGIDYGADGSVIRTGIACCVDIPEKFTIIEAKLIVQHSTLKSYEYSNELTTYFGNCRNISCTKTNSIEYERLGASSIVYQPVIPLYKGEEVSNIGSFYGSQTKEFTITDKLSTGIQYLIFADYVDNPSTFNDAYNLTGHITAFVDVTGYMRI